MALLEEGLPIASGELEATIGEPGDVEGDVENGVTETEKSPGLMRLRRSRGALLGLTFVAGLFLGWMVIGWWLWPVEWTNSAPWLLSPEHQRTYVGLVAENYWHAKDISRARNALSGWDDEALANLLATMQAQASSLDDRRHLAALAEALALPDPEESLLTSLPDQKSFIFLILSTVVSALPLAAAIVLAVSPLVRNRIKQSEELLGQGMGEIEEELERLLVQEREQEQEQGTGKQGDGEKDLEAETEDEGEARERDEESEEGDEDEWLDEEVGETDQSVGDILTSIFEDEDETLMYLESLCKDLEDVDTSDLIGKGQQVLDQLTRSNTLRHE